MKQVSKALKIKALNRPLTIKDNQDRITHLQKLIASGKLRGILLQRAHEYIRKCEYNIRQLKKKEPDTKAINQRLAQMSLPSFVKQMDFVKFEELLAEKLAAQMMTEIRSQKKAKVS